MSVAHNSAKVYRKKAFVQVFCTRKTAALLRPCLSGATKAATKTDVHEHRHVGSAACKAANPAQETLIFQFAPVLVVPTSRDLAVINPQAVFEQPVAHPLRLDRMLP